MAPVHDLPRTIAETVAAIKAAKTKNERIEILKANSSEALKAIIRLNFDPRIKFELPEGFPANYKPSVKPDGFGETTLKAIYKKFYIFVKESTPGLRQAKRETIFLQLLEQLDRQEAKVLVDAKDKKLDIGLTRKVIDEVFPGLLPAEVKSAKSTSTGEVNEAESPDKGV